MFYEHICEMVFNNQKSAHVGEDVFELEAHSEVTELQRAAGV